MEDFKASFVSQLLADCGFGLKGTESVVDGDIQFLVFDIKPVDTWKTVFIRSVHPKRICWHLLREKCLNNFGVPSERIEAIKQVVKEKNLELFEYLYNERREV